MRFALPVARWLQRLQFLAACVGLLLIAVTVLPVLDYWATALSAPWGNENGDLLIVLGADMTAPDMIGLSSYWRSVYAVRAWRTGHYHCIVLTGKNIAPLMKDFLTTEGVPPQVILVENEATSTRENALNVAALLKGNSSGKVLLTSDFHMRRALDAFRKAGIDASPLPIPDVRKRSDDWTQRWGLFWILAEETVKLVYYKAHGWA